MPPSQRGYTSGLFALELEGTSVGFVSSVDGGAIFGLVAESDQGSPPVRHKARSWSGVAPDRN
jgi:hypothetical protein